MSFDFDRKNFPLVFRAKGDSNGSYTSDIVNIDGNKWSLSVKIPKYHLIKGPVGCILSYHGCIEVIASLCVTMTASGKKFDADLDSDQVVVAFSPQNRIKNITAWKVDGVALSKAEWRTVLLNELEIRVDIDLQPQKLHMNQPLEHCLASDLTSIFHSGAHSDMSISVEDTTIPLHKVIVCGRSAVLAAALSSDMTEGSTNVIMISDFELPVVRGFVEYMYTEKCVENCMDEYSDELFMIGHKYELLGLCAATENHMSSTLTTDNVLNRLLLASTYSAKCLRQNCCAFLRQNKEVLVSVKQLDCESYRELMEYTCV